MAKVQFLKQVLLPFDTVVLSCFSSCFAAIPSIHSVPSGQDIERFFDILFETIVD